MSEEKEKTEPAEDKGTQLEVELAKEQSAEHAKEIAQQSADILPVEPLPEPAPAPEPTPTVEPVPVPGGACPICGKAGWKNQQALAAHIRFGHKQNRTGARNIKSQRESVADNGEIPGADFSDIDGSQPAPTPVVEPGPKLPNYAQTAAMSFDMTTGLLTRIFGPEWQPQSVEERAMVVTAIEAYYRSVELPDIPPGYMLCFVVAAYAAPRLNAPPTRTKLQALWLWVKMKFTRKKHVPIKVIQQTAKDDNAL